MHWDPERDYDRLGLSEDTISLLDVKLPLLRIPVSPGRSVATLIEVAARNHILKIMGYDSSVEFAESLNKTIRSNKVETDKKR